MTLLLHQLPARHSDSGLFNVVVDTPKGRGSPVFLRRWYHDI